MQVINKSNAHLIDPSEIGDVCLKMLLIQAIEAEKPVGLLHFAHALVAIVREEDFETKRKCSEYLSLLSRTYRERILKKGVAL